MSTFANGLEDELENIKFKVIELGGRVKYDPVDAFRERYEQWKANFEEFERARALISPALVLPVCVETVEGRPVYIQAVSDIGEVLEVNLDQLVVPLYSRRLNGFMKASLHLYPLDLYPGFVPSEEDLVLASSFFNYLSYLYYRLHLEPLTEESVREFLEVYFAASPFTFPRSLYPHEDLNLWVEELACVERDGL